MRYLPLAAVVLCGLSAPVAPARAQAVDGCTGPVSDTKLYVDVGNVRAARGLIAVTLYADIRKKFLAHHGSL